MLSLTLPKRGTKVRLTLEEAKGATLASFPTFPHFWQPASSSLLHSAVTVLCRSNSWIQMTIFLNLTEQGLTVAHPHAPAPIWDLPLLRCRSQVQGTLLQLRGSITSSAKPCLQRSGFHFLGTPPPPGCWVLIIPTSFLCFCSLGSGGYFLTTLPLWYFMVFFSSFLIPD